MGFCAILSLILVLAKIFSLITLSWAVCLAPFLIGFVIKMLIIILMFLAVIFSD